MPTLKKERSAQQSNRITVLSCRACVCRTRPLTTPVRYFDSSLYANIGLQYSDTFELSVVNNSDIRRKSTKISYLSQKLVVDLQVNPAHDAREGA